MTVRAGLDIGTNTLLLLVAEVAEGKVSRVLRDETRVVRLGQGVDKNRAFSPEAMERGRKVFAEYGDILKDYPGVKVRAAATSGSRDAKNSRAYFAEMEKLLGFPIAVISGDEEALVSFRGAVSDKSETRDLAVIDIGGGSTEIITETGTGKLAKKSFDMGCVRLTERFLANDPPKDAELENMRAFVRTELAREAGLLANFGEKRWVGVAGTATYLSSASLGLLRFDPEKIHGAELSVRDIQALFEKFKGLTSKERLGLGGMDAGRADVILAGAVILEETLKAAGRNELEISVRGLRYGLVLG